MEHYRCYTVYINKNRAEIIAGVVDFFPEHNKIPVIYNQEVATNMVLDLLEAVTKPSPTSPFASIGAGKLQSISNLVDVFKQKHMNARIGFRSQVFVKTSF